MAPSSIRPKIKDILRIETTPGLGCTEPAAIGLATAAAASLVPGSKIDKVEVLVDPNLYKNGMAVYIPGSDGRSGLELAGAMGATGGDPLKGLQVFESMDSQSLVEALTLAHSGQSSTDIKRDTHGLFVHAIVTAGGMKAEAVIQGTHDHIASLALDGRDQPNNPLLASGGGGDGELEAIESWIRDQPVSELLSMLDELDNDDFTYLQQGLTMNRRLAEYGLKHGSGMGVGMGLESISRMGLIKKDMLQEARILTSAGIDARMGGAPLAAMTLAGSGNQGLTASLPLVAANRYARVEDEQVLLKALALSYLVTVAIKARTGRLSALCGSGTAGGSGVAAGVVYLFGGSLKQIEAAITNLIEDNTGILCDGAKPSCALKLSAAAGASIQAALLALHNIVVDPKEGIIGKTAKDTMDNVGLISTRGMNNADPVMLEIMLKKKNR